MLAPQNNLLIRQSWVIVYQSTKEHHVDGAPREGSWYNSVGLVDTVRCK